jgi:diphosphomevalonate decarboxylase
MNQVLLVDAADQPIGIADKLQAHLQGLLHRAFSVFILRHQNHTPELLLQQRQLSKYHAGGLWTNTCCSHPQPGEATIAAAERRLQEELGFTVPLIEIGIFTYRAEFPNAMIEHEVDHVLLGYLDDPSIIVQPNPEEIMAVRWVTLEKAQQECKENPDHYTPWFAQALSMITHHL